MKQASLLCNDEILVERLFVAVGSFQRMKGLLGRKHFPQGEGLYLEPAPVIHTFFMRFKLDLIFLDSNMRVTCYRKDVKPFQIVHGGKGAHSVVEVESGWLGSGAAAIGAKLNIQANYPD
ncbi:MAG: DUF192 domain-containing protein [Verrucomicrobiota bacterium]